MIKLSVAEAQAIIHQPKRTASPMKWQAKAGNYNPKRFSFESVLFIESTAREDLFLRLQYRGEFSQYKAGLPVIRSANIASGLFAANNRIFAYDFDEGKPHTNKKGNGMPYYKKQIIGLHQHIWVEEGYGYAEPLKLTNNKLETIITAFSKAANIELIDGFVAPPSEQFDLFQ